MKKRTKLPKSLKVPTPPVIAKQILPSHADLIDQAKSGLFVCTVSNGVTTIWNLEGDENTDRFKQLMRFMQNEH